MSSADSISIRVLGGVRVEGTDGTLTPRQQTLLGVLAVRRRSVSADTLVDVLWPDEPPANPRSALQVHVSRLRRILESVGATIHRDGDSYALQVERHRLDLAEFERLAGEGTALIGADPANGIAVLNRALELWQVDPPPILRDSLELRGELSRLNELRSSALETRIAAEIELGRTGEAIVELRRLVAENPVREQLTRLLMLALSSLGRVSEALDSYDRLGRSLAEELGIEPGTEIEELRSNLVGRATEAETTEDAQTARERHSRVVSARAALERPAADDVARGLEYVELASALRDETGSSGETAAAVARALELIPDTPTEARARALVASAWLWGTAPEVAAAHADHAIELTELIGSAVLLSEALVLAGAAETMLGGIEVGRELALRSRFVAEQAGNRDGMFRSYAILAESLLLAGEPGEAADTALSGLARLGSASAPRSHRVALATTTLAALARSARWAEAHQFLSTFGDDYVQTVDFGSEAVRFLSLAGDLDAAQGILDRLLATESKHDPRLGLAESWLALCRNDWATVYTAATRALRSIVHRPAVANELVFLAVTGARSRGDGRRVTTAARNEVIRLVTALRSGPSGMRPAAAWALLAQAQANGMEMGAIEKWQTALEAWNQIEGWPEASVLARTGLAIAAGPESTSAELLGAAIAEAQRIESKPLERVALAGANRIGFDPTRPDVFEAWSLTPREREVLEQLADGSSNRVIAERLGISEKTASVHVSNLLQKIGLTSRTELALLAAQHR